MAKDSKEAVKYRVRLFRKRQRRRTQTAEQHIRGGAQANVLPAPEAHDEWSGRFFRRDVYTSIEVFLSLQISFESFVTAIRGSKKDDIKPVKSVELSELIAPNGESILLVRPVHIPAPRRRK